MNIEVHEKYYLVTYSDKPFEVVRRDVYWDSGWKDERQVQRCKEIEAILENNDE